MQSPNSLLGQVVLKGGEGTMYTVGLPEKHVKATCSHGLDPEAFVLETVEECLDLDPAEEAWPA